MGSSESHASGPNDQRRPSEALSIAHDDHRIELCPGARDELASGDFPRHRLLVGPFRDDHVVGVCDGGDTPGQRDLFTGEARRIAAPIPSFVVVAGGQSPLSEPRVEGTEHPATNRWVTPQHGPLSFGKGFSFVEDFRWDEQLAQIVKKDTPRELVTLARRNAEFVGEAPAPKR